MGRAVAIAFAAAFVSGCSGLQGTVASLSQGGGPSNNAADQQDCEDRFGRFGASAILDCRLEKGRQRRAAAAATGPAQQ